MEDFKQDIKYLREELNDLQLKIKEVYIFMKKEINEICDYAKQGIYLPQKNFERTLDVLLDTALHIDVKEEFDLMINIYSSMYPDSVDIYRGFYNELIEEVK